jgi:hypothetical protein
MPSSGSCGQGTRGVIFNFGYLRTNKTQGANSDGSCYKHPIPDDTPLPFGHRKIMSYWDAEIIEASRAMGCTHVLSEDLNDGQDFGGVQVTNPFH